MLVVVVVMFLLHTMQAAPACMYVVSSIFLMLVLACEVQFPAYENMPGVYPAEITGNIRLRWSVH